MKDYPINIGGKTYSLRYNLDALIMVEDHTQTAFVNTFKSLLSGNFGSLKLLFSAGLKANHPTITFDEVSAIIDECESIAQLIITVGKAINYYLTKKEPVESTEDTKKKVDSSTPMAA